MDKKQKSSVRKIKELKRERLKDCCSRKAAFSSMSSKNSQQSFSRKRKHDESQSPAREPGEIRNSDRSRHNSISSSYKNYSKPKHYFNGKQNNNYQKPSNFVKEYSIDKCVSKMISKEIERSKNEKYRENDSLKSDVKKLKEDCYEISGELNEVKTKLDDIKVEMNNNNGEQQQKNYNDAILDVNRKIENMQINFKYEIILELTNIFEQKIAVAIESAMKIQNDKIDSIKNTVDEISDKVNEIEEQLEDGRQSEATNITTNLIENTVVAVMEEKLTEKQKEMTMKEPHIPLFPEPKWLVSKEKCNDLHRSCQGQVAKFLVEYLPLLFDLPEIITPLKRGPKKEEVQAVLIHFWRGSLSMELITKEIEKEHAAQRYKTSRKIYLGLKNSDGVIMSNRSGIFECEWNVEKKKYVPKSEITDDSDGILEWQLPREIKKFAYEKGKDYIIVAKNDNSNQTRICKIDLADSTSELLYIKRKYGNT